MERIITTDPEADIVLEANKDYFIDFEATGQTATYVGEAGIQEFLNRFKSGMAERGHPVTNCSVAFPGYDEIRIYFRTTNPPHLFIIIAICVAIIMVGMATSVGVYTVFLRLGELVAEPFKLAETAIQKAVENPIPVIAILLAVAITFFGFMRK